MTASQETTRGWYVYGILPADVELRPDLTGVGDPPAPVRLVRSGDLAALVSELDPDRPLGTPDDLTAHKQILDASAAGVPVLPMRFGAVLANREAVATELLDPYHDDFAAALGDLDGRAEYVVKGRYTERAILEEILAENPRAERLREQIQDKDADATRDLRIELGELIAAAISAKREEDTKSLGDAMAGHCVASLVREPSHERDAVHVAFLIDTGQQNAIEKVIDDLAQQWAGRMELRLLGPMAAYDFVGAT